MQREERKKIQKLLDEVNEATEALDKFHGEVMKKWSCPSWRALLLGHITRSLPITLSAGTEGFAEEYTIVELDSSKIKKVFRQRTKILANEFTLKVYPHTDAPKSFEYPVDRPLEFQGLIKEDQMRNRDMPDHDGEPCLLVIKNGNTTDVTSMEWAILPYDNKSGVFPAPNDSGSIIVDGRGGLLISGAGKMESLDVTYAKVLSWLLPYIKLFGNPLALMHQGQRVSEQLPQPDHGLGTVTSARTTGMLAISFYAQNTSISWKILMFSDTGRHSSIHLTSFHRNLNYSPISGESLVQT